MVSSAGEVAKARGCEWLDLQLRETAKNAPAQNFLTGLAPLEERLEAGDGLVVFRLKSEDAAAVRFRPGQGGKALGEAGGAPTRAERGGQVRSPSSLLRRIATELADAEQIRQAVDASRRRARPDLADGYVAAKTETEIGVAALWCDALGLDRVGTRDDFFALGGHSLLATLLVSRLRDTFGGDIGLDTFFERPTVAGLAQWIEEQRIARAAPTELTEMLRALDDLSDEEVEALLASDERPTGRRPAVGTDEVRS